MEYASQVVSNVFQHGLTTDVFTEGIDVADIGLAAAEGFVTCGTSTISKDARVGIKIGFEVARGALDAEIKNGKCETKAKVPLNSATLFKS